jgi:hypothetical protein
VMWGTDYIVCVPSFSPDIEVSGGLVDGSQSARIAKATLSDASHLRGRNTGPVLVRRASARVWSQ